MIVVRSTQIAPAKGLAERRELQGLQDVLLLLSTVVYQTYLHTEREELCICRSLPVLDQPCFLSTWPNVNTRLFYPFTDLGSIIISTECDWPTETLYNMVLPGPVRLWTLTQHAAKMKDPDLHRGETYGLVVNQGCQFRCFVYGNGPWAACVFSFWMTFVIEIGSRYSILAIFFVRRHCHWD